MINSERRTDIDLLKGLSILAVVLYHIGLLESGYLGVDVFFVIAGFLTIPKIVCQVQNEQFKYIRFIWNRVLRLLPILLIASGLCLIIGLFFWLPDDYENLSQSVIASTVFANNILSAITTKNYWDTVNAFKPLMHTWYLGILMQFYVVFPIITLILHKISILLKKNFIKTITIVTIVLTLCSFVLFLLPNVSAGDRFYLLPFRLYEILFGGIVGLCAHKANNLNKNFLKALSFVSLFLILALLIIGVFTFDLSKINTEHVVIGGESSNNSLLLPNSILVSLSVLFTAIFLFTSKDNALLNKTCIFPLVGKRSFSIFIWHQVFLALYRYSIKSTITVWFLLIFSIILFVISELSYRFIENKITKKWTFAIIILSVLICSFSGVIYLRAGVIREVPELGISVDNANAGVHGKYCDRVYGYDKDFETTDKIKVLLIGNSFARDFGNILLESEYANAIELSYSVSVENEIIDRIRQADKIFVFNNKENLPDSFWANVNGENIVYGIGTKNFGHINGQIYFNRFKNTYFEQTVPLDPGYKEANEKMRTQWGDQYIDMIAPVMIEDRIRVFSDENMYISQDTRHLTQAGAQYYTKLLDIKGYLYE